MQLKTVEVDGKVRLYIFLYGDDDLVDDSDLLESEDGADSVQAG